MAEVVATKPTFSVSDDGKQLRITLRPGDAPLPADIVGIKAYIKAAGHGAFVLNDEALKNVAAVATGVTKETTFDIGIRRDGIVQVKISKDEMEATATVMPPQGGDPVTREMVRAALRAQNVVSGIMIDAIEKAIREAKGEPLVVAKGTPAEAGQDGKLESRVRKVGGARPQIRDDGRADMRELDQFVSVRAGDLLMVIVPPTQGKAGVNVRGQVIPAKAGREVEFPLDLQGTKIDPKNKTRLLAAEAGRPVVTPEGIYVDPNLEIKKVDVSTGNVRFEGDISISGDIRSGSKVIVTGSVEIGGTVESAVIEAGGDITIRYGVMGRTEPRDANGKLVPGAAILKGAGRVSARFLSNVMVDAGTDVVIEDTVTHSEINAGAELVIGADGGKKGQAIGGLLRARQKVHVLVLGSPAAVKTRVEVGVSAATMEKHEEVAKAHAEKLEEINKLNLIEVQLKGTSRPDVQEKLARTRKKLDSDLAEIDAKAGAIKAEIDQYANVEIVVEKRLYPGVSVVCNGKEMAITDERGPGSFAIRDGVLTYQAK